MTGSRKPSAWTSSNRREFLRNTALVSGAMAAAGSVDYKGIAQQMRTELKRRIVAKGEPDPVLHAQRFFV